MLVSEHLCSGVGPLLYEISETKSTLISLWLNHYDFIFGFLFMKKSRFLKEVFMKRSILDDGFQAYLTKDATLVGDAGIPLLMDLKNTQIPNGMIPFGKARTCSNHRQYVHFYSHDKTFSAVLTSTTKYLDLLKQYDGVISPDCSILVNQARCLQQTNTYMNRAVGFYLQKQGIPVIPNVRWGDETTFDFCFLGIPQNSIVCISTHGCLRTKRLREIFKAGLPVMLDVLNPTTVLVHGFMPDDVFGDYLDRSRFVRYASEFEQTHSEGGDEDGARI